MRKLFISLVVLFVAMVAQAQSSIEKDVLGNWYLKSVGFDGTFYDFDSGKVDFSKEALEDMAAKNKDPEAVAKAMQQAISKMYKSLTLSLNPDGTMQLNKNGVIKDEEYKIIYENGKHWLIGSTATKAEVAVTDGLMHWLVYKEGVTLEMNFKII